MHIISYSINTEFFLLVNIKLVAWLIYSDRRLSVIEIGSFSRTTKAVVGVSDLDGDGVSDILFMNKGKTAMQYYWKIAKSGMKIGEFDIKKFSSAWSVVGLDDLDGDATDDILFRRNKDGLLHYWPMKEGKSKD